MSDEDRARLQALIAATEPGRPTRLTDDEIREYLRALAKALLAKEGK